MGGATPPEAPPPPPPHRDNPACGRGAVDEALLIMRSWTLTLQDHPEAGGLTTAGFPYTVRRPSPNHYSLADGEFEPAQFMERVAGATPSSSVRGTVVALAHILAAFKAAFPLERERRKAATGSGRLSGRRPGLLTTF